MEMAHNMATCIHGNQMIGTHAKENERQPMLKEKCKEKRISVSCIMTLHYEKYNCNVHDRS
jgi:hypothetical protein